MTTVYIADTGVFVWCVAYSILALYNCNLNFICVSDFIKSKNIIMY